jgi:hypothetical protein
MRVVNHRERRWTVADETHIETPSNTSAPDPPMCSSRFRRSAETPAAMAGCFGQSAVVTSQQSPTKPCGGRCENGPSARKLPRHRSLAKRPYDLRHAAVSTWLASGVEAPRVAVWAGHSVDVLLRVYAKFLDGQEEVARQRIEASLGG